MFKSMRRANLHVHLEPSRPASVPAALRSAAASLCLAVLLTLTACGSSSKPPSAKAGAKTQTKAATQASAATQQAQALKESTSGLATPTHLAPSTVLAHVGATPITFATVKNQMLLASPQVPLPDPPTYSSCTARLKATPSGAAQTEAALQQSCEQSYKHLLQLALSGSIHTQWIVSEAAEEGANVSEREVREEFAASKKQFRTEAEFATYRKSTGQTIADMMSEIKLGKLTDRLFADIKKKEHPISNAEVVAYYRANPAKYTVPEGRDVQILRTTTEASALRAKQEIQSGKSFQSIVKELSTIAQPITAKNGEVKDLIPHLFEEKKLNDAIFSAQPNRLYGPVTIVESHATIGPESGSGSYVFEVKSIIPARAVPIVQVKSQIAEELAKGEKEKVVSAAIAAIKAKWRSRTACEPGFVVKNCSQFKSSAKEAEADPYTL